MPLLLLCLLISGHSLPFPHLTVSPSLTLTKTVVLFPCVFYGRPQRGVKDELVFSVQTASGGDSSIDPTLADLLLLTNKSISHINYSAPPQLHFSSAICPLCDSCCVWLWLTLCSLYLHNSIFQANPDSVLFLKSQRSTALLFFLSFCVLILVSQQAQCAPGKDPSPDQSGSSTEPFLWPWGGRHHSCGKGGGGTHCQKGLFLRFFVAFQG